MTPKKWVDDTSLLGFFRVNDSVLQATHHTADFLGKYIWYQNCERIGYKQTSFQISGVIFRFHASNNTLSPYQPLMTSQKSSLDLDRLPPTGPGHLVICICSCRSIIMVILPARSKMLATSCIKRTGQVVIISLGAIWGMTSSKLWSTPNLKNFPTKEKWRKTKKNPKSPMKHDRSRYPIAWVDYMKLSEYWKHLLLWSPILTSVKTLVRWPFPSCQTQTLQARRSGSPIRNPL